MTRTRSVVMDPERRGLPSDAARLTIRADDDGNERFVGHAAVFDVRTAIGNPLRWGFYEEIAPNAFTKTLGEADARFLLDHDSYYVVARMSAGTLGLAQDSVGLAVDSALDTELSYVGDLKANLRNGNITGMSFGFYVVKDSWTTEEIEVAGLDDPVEVEVRRILEVRLVEVSAVTFPAYESTDAGLRAVRRALLGRGDADAIRRRAGFEPELATLLDEIPGCRASDDESQVESTTEEPAETTPRSQSTDEDGTEPGETTRNAPSAPLLAAARMRALRAQLRRPAAA
jgi:HK97 family phage prohead protease